MATTYEKIASTTLGSATASISFTSIAASWTDIRVVFTGSPTSAGDGYFRFNNDSTSLYSTTRLGGDGSSASSVRRSNIDRIYMDDLGITDSAQPLLYTIDLFSYAGSTYKTCLTEQVQDLNGSGYVARLVGLYRSTSAITRIDIISPNTWITGSTATIYGIKAA
jgi:hypothetical protein